MSERLNPSDYLLPKSEKFLDFVYLTDSQREELRRRVENSQGRIFILVHPFFEMGLLILKEYRDYRWALGKTVEELRGKEAPPLIVFEDMTKSLETLQKMIRVNEFENPVFFLRTQPETAEPVPGWPKGLELFCKSLRQIGVSQIIIGGQYLKMEIRQRSNSSQTWCLAYTRQVEKKRNLDLGGRVIDLDYCLGDVIRWAAKEEFEVVISRATFLLNVDKGQRKLISSLIE